MNLNNARQMAKKLATLDSRPYAIWLAQTIYQRRDRKGDDSQQYLIRPYNSYDQYKDGFVEFCSARAEQVK